MRVLVIGATGFLGSHVARHLTAVGHAVTGLSRSAEGDTRIAALGATPARGDLSDIALVGEIAAAHDATIYAAQLLLEPEFEALRALIARLSGKALIFTSGTGLLAQRTDGEWSEDSFAEDDAFTPSRYIGFRHVTETLVRSAGSSGAVRAMVVRPPLIWGNGGCGHARRFWRDAFEHGEVAYLGRGLNLYSNVHVEDLAEVYRLAIERGTAGALYHAVAGEVANRTIAQGVAALAGVPARSIDISEAIERWGKFETLVGMATCSRSRSPRTRRELGWSPRHLDLMADIGHPAFQRLRPASA
jgi:nucleoside-diphosphate-sugar epimerase